MSSCTDNLGFWLRKTPDFKGKQRLARLLLGKKLKTYRDFYVKAKYDCTFKVPNLTETIGFELFVNGVFENEIIDFIISHIPEKGVFMDLGANIGTISVPVSRLRPDAYVFSVEASPFVVQYLGENIELNDCNNIRLFEGAVVQEEGLSVDFYFPEENFGKGALTNLFSAKSQRVPSLTIDQIVRENNLKSVDLIKVDIEGAEKLAFMGGEKLLSREDAPSLLFEFVDYAERAVDGLSAGDGQAYLLDLGFDLFVLNGMSLLPLKQPLRSGFAMIFARKSIHVNQK